jgi:hypothetical protein
VQTEQSFGMDVFKNVFTGGDSRISFVNARRICNHMCLHEIHVTALRSFENIAFVCDPGNGSGLEQR